MRGGEGSEHWRSTCMAAVLLKNGGVGPAAYAAVAADEAAGAVLALCDVCAQK
jgi:hypothetical protein